MKKRIAAIMLSFTLCMSGVMQAEAASFADPGEAVPAAVFGDSAVSTDNSDAASSEEVLPEGTDTLDGQDVEAVTPAPSSEENISSSDAEEGISEEIPVQDENQPTDDVEIFNAGEGTDVPDDAETAISEEEILAAPTDRIYISNWSKVNGKWKLRKPVSDTLAASADVIDDVSEPAYTEEPADMPEDTEQFVQPESDETVPDEVVSFDETELNLAAAYEYYTAADGIVHIQTYQSVGTPNTLIADGYYYFDAEGYMITGPYTVPAGTVNFNYTAATECFFMNEANAKWNSLSYSEYTPVNSNLGQMQKKYWLWTGSSFRYYSGKGGFISVDSLKKIREQEGNYTGYYLINGNKYFLNSDGTPRTGTIIMNEGIRKGEYYALPSNDANGIPGKVLCSSWLRLTDSKGQVQWKKYLSDGRRWTPGIVATRLDSKLDGSVGKYYYLLSEDGYILKSQMAKASNGYYYGTDKYGRLYTNRLVKYNNARYYFGSNGRRVSWTNSWHRIASSGNRYYYFGKTPGMVSEKTGWQKVITVSGKSAGWYYFTRNGNHYTDVLTAAGRYFRPDGRLASGITTVNGNTYFFQGSTSTTPKGVMYKNTWIYYQKHWYYAGSSGVLYKNGWKYINGYYYYFNSDYTVKTNSAVTKDGKKGYVDSRGRFYSSGWLIVNDAKNQVKYIDPDTGNLLTNTSKVINGLRYYFDANGYRINDLTNVYKGPYYLVVDRVNGVMTVYDSSRTVPVKTIRVSVGLPGTPTWPTNVDMRLTSYNRWQALMGPSWGQYGTHVDGAGNGGIFIHSIAGGSQSYYNVSPSAYNMLGNPASHGCIRCCVADARWVFYNCNGSTIRIIDGTYNSNESMKGPLGRHALVPMYGSMNFDPTDNLAWH